MVVAYSRLGIAEVWPRQWQAPWTKVRPRINHVTMHLLAPHLPFGGVGPAGIGHYYGKYGFDMLTHAKSMLISPPDAAIEHLFPPY